MAERSYESVMEEAGAALPGMNRSDDGCGRGHVIVTCATKARATSAVDSG